MSTRFTISLNPTYTTIDAIGGFRLAAGTEPCMRYGVGVWAGIVAGRRNRSVLQSRAWRIDR